MKTMKACSYLIDGTEITSDRFSVKEENKKIFISFFIGDKNDEEQVAKAPISSITDVFGIHLSGSDTEKYQQIYNFLHSKKK